MNPSTCPLAWLAATALLAAAPPSQGGAQQAEPAERVLELTLEDAVRIVLEHNLELQIEALTSDVSRFDYFGSWGAFDPVLSLRGEYFDSEIEAATNVEGGSGFVVDVQSRNYQQNLTFPLLSGGSLDFQYRMENQETSNPNAALDVSTDARGTVTYTQPLLRGAWTRYATSQQHLSELEYHKQVQDEREVRLNLVLRVHEAYWNLVQAIEQEQVRELTLRLGREQLDQDRRRLEVGVGTEVDVLQAETNVATNEEQLLRARVDVQAAMDALKALLFNRVEEEDWGRYLADWETPIVCLTQLPEVDEPAAREWTRSLGHALDQRTELVRQRLEVEAQNLRLARAESETLPGLDLSLSAGTRGFDGQSRDAVEESFDADFPTYTAGLSFDVPLFNRRASFARRAARIGIRVARLTYDRLEQEVVADVRGKVREVNYQAKAVQAAKKSLELARRQLQAEQARYEEGLSTTFQVLQFQEDLAQALSTEKAARAAHARAQAALLRAEGRIEESSAR